MNAMKLTYKIENQYDEGQPDGFIFRFDKSLAPVEEFFFGDVANFAEEIQTVLLQALGEKDQAGSVGKDSSRSVRKDGSGSVGKDGSNSTGKNRSGAAVAGEAKFSGNIGWLECRKTSTTVGLLFGQSAPVEVDTRALLQAVEAYIAYDRKYELKKDQEEERNGRSK